MLLFVTGIHAFLSQSKVFGSSTVVQYMSYSFSAVVFHFAFFHDLVYRSFCCVDILSHEISIFSLILYFFTASMILSFMCALYCGYSLYR